MFLAPAKHRSRPVALNLESLEERQVLSPATLVPRPTLAPALMATTTTSASQQAPIYRVLARTIIPGNPFVEDVYATRIGGPGYIVHFTVAKNCCQVGGTLQMTAAPTIAQYYMVVGKSINPRAANGSMKLSPIVSWFNGKPTIKGLNYGPTLTVPRAVLNAYAIGQIVTQYAPGRWRKMYGNLPTEQFVVQMNGKLPNLLNGTVQIIADPDSRFNCLTYAANRFNAIQIGWTSFPAAGEVDPRPPGATGPTLWDMQSFWDFYSKHGWVQRSGRPPAPTGNQEYIVIYGRFGNDLWGKPTVPLPLHAAVWTSQGVFAKMGSGGTFRFSSIEQMSGGIYGQPIAWLQRR